MFYQKYTLTHIQRASEDSSILTLVSRVDKTLSFISGQYVSVRSPSFTNPHEAHPFSLASSENTKDSLELFIRSYGNFTKHLLSLSIGETLEAAGPFGKFTWNKKTDRNSVFLVGGVGITPIISILRMLSENDYRGNYCIIYGNRSEGTVGYKEELEKICKKLTSCSIVHVFSETAVSGIKHCYTGFITKEILEKEVNFLLNPTFFISGPPIFIQKMNTLLSSFSIDFIRIKKEEE